MSAWQVIPGGGAALNHSSHRSGDTCHRQVPRTGGAPAVRTPGAADFVADQARQAAPDRDRPDLPRPVGGADGPCGTGRARRWAPAAPGAGRTGGVSGRGGRADQPRRAGRPGPAGPLGRSVSAVRAVRAFGAGRSGRVALVEWPGRGGRGAGQGGWHGRRRGAVGAGRRSGWSRHPGTPGRGWGGRGTGRARAPAGRARGVARARAPGSAGGRRPGGHAASGTGIGRFSSAAAITSGKRSGVQAKAGAPRAASAAACSRS